MYSITFYLQAHRVYCFLVFSSTHTYTIHTVCTGKSMSEASTNPQYDDRLFIELQVVHENYKLSTCLLHKLFLAFDFDIQNNLWVS